MKDKQTNPGLELSSVGMLIVAARRLIRQIVGDLVAPYELTPHQYWLMMILHDSGPLCLTELATALWMDDPTISRMVKYLSEQNILTVEPDPHHGRRIIIRLSNEGEKLWTKLNSVAQDFRIRAEKGLTAAEKATMRKGLVQTIINLEEIQHEVATFGSIGEHSQSRSSKPKTKKVR